MTLLPSDVEIAAGFTFLLAPLVEEVLDLAAAISGKKTRVRGVGGRRGDVVAGTGKALERVLHLDHHGSRDVATAHETKRTSVCRHARDR